MGGRWSKIEKIEVRCKGTYRGEPCNRKLVIGIPGFDVITGEAKIIEIKCPRCGATNLISSEMFERVVVRLKK